MANTSGLRRNPDVTKQSDQVVNDPTATSAVPWRENLEELRFGAAVFKSETLSTPTSYL